MAGVVWVKGSPQEFRVSPVRYTKTFHPRLKRRLQQVIDMAVVDAKRFTAASGRVETGNMMDAIVGRVVEDNVDEIVGEFGFLDRQEMYFFLQTDTGFRHWLSGEFIEPTMALQDAARLAFARLMERQV